MTRSAASKNPRQQSVYVPSVQFWEQVKEAAKEKHMTASAWLCSLAEPHLKKRKKP